MIEFTATIQSSKGFYIGDICYVLSEDVYYGLWKGTNYVDGSHHESTTGADFAVGSTENGDGRYYDQWGHQYPVDAGVIGCVPYELLDQPEIKRNYSYRTNPDADLVEIINNFGYYVDGDTATFYATGEGEFVITIRQNKKVVKSIHIDTRYLSENNY